LIAKRNTTAARWWLDLCAIQDTCSLFALIIPDNPYLELLEALGFITTTETMSMIIVKVHGKEQDGLGSFFCGGMCE
jgi:hypothetical protein